MMRPVVLLRRIFAYCFMAASSLPGAFMASPVIAQEESLEQDEGIICLAIGHRWVGTPAERERIAEEPVPQSFLQIFHDDGCTGWQLLPESLLDWHIRYGTAQSAMAAIRFLENEQTNPVVEDLPGNFPAAWEAALGDARELVAQELASNPAMEKTRLIYVLSGQLMGLSSIERVSALGSRWSHAEFIAGEYTRAANAFSSEELLREGRRVHDPAYELAQFMDRQDLSDPVVNYLVDQVHPRFRSDRMSPQSREITLAVVEAAIHGDDETVLAADVISRQLYGPNGRTRRWPDLFTFLQMAYVETDDLCQVDMGNSREDYAERCNENGFEDFALHFWYERSRLEIIAQQAGIALEPIARRSGNAPPTIDLYLRRAWAEGWRYGQVGLPPEPIRLLMWSGEASLAANTAICDGAGAVDGWLIDNTMTPLARAQSLSDPTRNPQLHREVSESYVQVYEALQACGNVSFAWHFQRGYLLAKAYLEQYPDLAAIEYTG